MKAQSQCLQSPMLATTVITTAAIQQALADKVGPNGAKEDQLKQGGLGEFYSKAGKDFYFGVGGHDFGQSLSGNAKS